MGQSESKEVANDGKYAELRRLAEQKGPVAMSKYLQENIQKWKEEKVKFAVTGRSATGKSTFINKIRNVKPRDPGYAKSGSGNTTKEPTPYQNPQNQLIVFYDLPGIGTLQFPKETYVSKMELCKYDYFFIFFDKVVNEDENFLICELLKLEKSYCLIRSKIDDDIRNAEDDGRTEEEVIPAIRQQINDQILCYSHLNHCDAIFLISSKRKDIGN
ncbi:interferon-inducible GTPase 1-like [Mytilus trossulus]|uniref:interferon-inducible GTPase 1-like n=1 Tax=Mytilus trossulus TaxID=6551 RepID=UPI003004A762